MLRNIPIMLKMACDPKCLKLAWRIHRLFSSNKGYKLKNLVRSGLHVIQNDRLMQHDGFFIVNSFIPPLNSDAFNSILTAVPGQGSKFFADHAAGKRSAPISIYIAATSRCMYNCWHCSAARLSSGGDMDTEAMIYLVRQMQDMGVGIIGFTGGEPLLRDDLEAVISSIDKRSVAMVFTSGYGLSPGRAKKLKAAGLFGIAISIDSLNAQKHDNGRCFEGAFNYALEAIGNSRQAGLYTMSQTVCTRELLAEDNLRKLAERMKREGVHEMRIIEPLPCGRLGAGSDEAMLSAEECEKLIDFHVRCNRDPNLPKVSVFSFFESQQRFGCGAGVQHSYIDNRGNLFPCDFVPVSFGNVFDTPLAALWKEMHEHMGGPRGCCFSKTHLNKLSPNSMEQYPVHIKCLPPIEQSGDEKLPGFYRILRGENL